MTELQKNERIIWKRYFIKNYVRTYYNAAVLKLKLPKLVAKPKFTKPVLECDAANQQIRRFIETGTPALVSRFGCVESKCIGEGIGIRNAQLKKFSRLTLQMIHNNAGVFPYGEDMAQRFCDIAVKSAKQVDLLGVWVNCDTAASEVYLAGHNDLNNVPESGSVYYVDVVAKDIAKINSITTELRLQTANKWELDNMIAADGFKAEYSYNDISKIATVTVTKTGNTTLAGEQTLVSIPVRVWEFDINTNVGGDGAEAAYMTKAERFNAYGEPKVFIDVRTLSGAVTYTDDTTGSFSSSISVATKLTGNKVNGPWHEHTITVLADKAATATENGYTGRTYCEVCGSVVDWGETLQAQGHSYVIVDGKFVCSDPECGDMYDAGTSLFEMNGKYYYAIGGNLCTGWQDVGEDKYYFDKTTYEGINGERVSYEVAQTGAYFIYSFTNGKLDSGVWVTTSAGTRYYYGNTCLGKGQYIIDGKQYAFNGSGIRYEGTCVIQWNPAGGLQLYEYTNEGVYVGELKTNGVFTVSNGDTYFFENGIAKYAGLVFEGVDYYYFSGSDLKAIKNRTVYITKTNDLLPAGNYTFDEDGKMIIKQGIVNDPDGNIRYYVDGVATYAGLVKDTDGSFYYISGNGCIAIRNRTAYITKTNDLLPAGNYTFGADGKMIVD